MISMEDVQNVLLDNDERRLINAYRRLHEISEFGELTAKIHRKRLVAIYSMEKWNANQNGNHPMLREVTE